MRLEIHLEIVIIADVLPLKHLNWSLDPTPSKPAPERNSTDLAMSVNVFVVNLDARRINVVKVGSKADNSVSTSSDYEMVY